VQLDEFVVMPDHIHGILFINKPDKMDWQAGKFGPQKNNLASIIRGYKSSVKQYAAINNIDFQWQPKYYDRVIRDEREYLNIKEYIYNNVDNWFSSKDNFENLCLP
jgi:REP element-mobilizing transposase RayT